MKIELSKEEIQMCITGLGWAVNEGALEHKEISKLYDYLNEQLQEVQNK